MNTFTRLLFIFLLITLFLVSCGERERFKDLRSYVSQLKQNKIDSAKQKPVPKVVTPVTATYTAKSLREPFEGMGTTVAAKKNVVVSSPLQGFPVSMLRFIGTLSQGKNTAAYILTPDNMVYQARVGDIIGDHYGKVINISPTELRIMEQDVENGNGSQRIVVLQLKENR